MNKSYYYCHAYAKSYFVFSSNFNKIFAIILFSCFGISCYAQAWTDIGTPLAINPNHFMYNVHFPTATDGYAVGSDLQGGTTLIKTTNAGTSWTKREFTSTSFASIFFADANIGYATGPSIIGKTTNGGINWISSFVPTTSAFIGKMFFTDVNTGFALVGGFLTNSSIMKTTNGGTNWTSQLSGTNSLLQSIHFPGSAIGYIVGNNGVARKTTNSGTDWTVINTGVTTQLNGVYFINPSIGFAVGFSNVIRKTTDGGTTWVALNSGLAANAAFRDVFFINSTTGYICGDNAMIKTTDGGTSWIDQTNTVTNNIRSIHFPLGSDIGFAVGSTQVIRSALPCAGTPIISTPNITSICTSSLETLTLNVSSPISGTTYLWSNNTTGTSAIISQAGSYSVRAISAGCTSEVSNTVVITGVSIAAPVINTPTTNSICPGSILTLNILNPIAGTTYLWSNNTNGTIAQINNSGTYTVRAISASCSSAASNPITITRINNLPTVSLVYQNFILSPVLVGDTSSLTYQWLRNDTLLPGQISRNFQPSLTGNYKIRISNNGCFITSSAILVSATGIGKTRFNGNILIDVYPNPNSGNFIIQSKDFKTNSKITIIDALGRTVLVLNSLEESNTIHLKTTGVYTAIIQNNAERIIRKIVVQ